MEETSTKTQADGTMLFAGDAWFDPIEAGIRDRVRGFIQELLEATSRKDSPLSVVLTVRGISTTKSCVTGRGTRLGGFLLFRLWFLHWLRRRIQHPP